MSLRGDLRSVVHEVRAIPADFGVRPYQAFAVTRLWSGEEPGEGADEICREEITEARGNPPRIRFLNVEEIAVGGFESGTVELGPVTPDFPGGGTLIDSVKRSGGGRRTLLHIELVGPEFPTGANFKLKETFSDRGYHYRFILERSADS